LYEFLISPMHVTCSSVVISGLIVTVFAIGPTVPGFEPGQWQQIFKRDKSS
jgi:hypothetical protein